MRLLISSLILSYPFIALFTNTNSLWLTYKSIKNLEIKTFMLFAFANNTILSCFFFVFSIIDLYFLITAVIAQVSNPIAELSIPIGIPSKEAKAEMKTPIGNT